MSHERLTIFDTTLRDGEQTPGIDFSVEDKIAIAKLLDGFGIDYVEGGYPGANPTDTAFFGEKRTSQATFVAFGMTKRAGRSVSNDPGVAQVSQDVLQKLERNLLRLREPRFAWAAFGLVVLVLVAWGPTPAFRQVIAALLLIGLLALGLEMLRRQTAREFPDARSEDSFPRLREWARGAPASTGSSDSAGCETKACSTPPSTSRRRPRYWPKRRRPDVPLERLRRTAARDRRAALPNKARADRREPPLPDGRGDHERRRLRSRLVSRP